MDPSADNDDHETGRAADTTDAADPPDPFAAQPIDDEGLVNVSADLEALLEYGGLERACADWEADPDDRRKELLCGKAMFFGEGFGALGIPAPIFDFVGTAFPEITGEGFSAYGLVPDPYSDEGRPLGFAPGAELEGAPGVETLALTCAACHFGRLPDGRFGVGAPAQGYDYGTHMLSLLLLPQAASPLFDESAHDPAALAKVQDLIDALSADWGLQLTLLWDLLPLLGAMDSLGAMDATTEGQYASWNPGTMDFVIAPLPVDDEVHTISKIPPLWGIPSEEEEDSAGMPHAMLAWSGGAQSLSTFLEGFVAIGGGDAAEWTPERLAPLEAYIRSLRPPANPDASTDAELLDRGEAIFYDGCVSCHGAPRGGGDRIYSFEEIGTDDQMMLWGDPDLDGELCCGLGDLGSGEATHGIKSPRLAGLWTFGRFLHNGSVDSLDALFCRDVDRPTITTPAYGDGGHTYGCELSDADVSALVAWLESK